MEGLIIATVGVLFVCGFSLAQDPQNYFFGQNSQTRFVPSYHSPRNSYFPSQKTFHDLDPTANEGTSSRFVSLPSYESTRVPDFFHYSPRPFAVQPPNHFGRPQSLQSLSNQKGSQSNIPHQQNQFLSHFNEQPQSTFSFGDKNQNIPNRPSRIFTNPYTRTRPSINGFSHSNEEVFSTQEHFSHRNPLNRYQNSNERTTSSLNQITEKSHRYNRFGSLRSTRTTPIPTTTTQKISRTRYDSSLYQPRRSSFTNHNNEKINLNNRFYGNRVNQFNKNFNKNKDDEQIEQKTNETNDKQSETIPVDEQKNLIENLENNPRESILNVNQESQPVILTSNFFLPSSEKVPDSEENDYSEEVEEEVDDSIVTTISPTEYDYEYEDYDLNTTTIANDKNLEINETTTPALKSTSDELYKDETDTEEYEEDLTEETTDYIEVENQTNQQNITNEIISENPINLQQKSNNVIGKAVVSVVTTKSVINGSTSLPKDTTIIPKLLDSNETKQFNEITTKSNDIDENPVIENDTLNNATEGYVVIASIQTSRSISGARFLPFPVVQQEEKKQPLSELERQIHEPKNLKLNKKLTELDIINHENLTETDIGTTELVNEAIKEVSTESIIDKIDNVQSKLFSEISKNEENLNETIDEQSLQKAEEIKTTTPINNKNLISIRKFMPRTTTVQTISRKINTENLEDNSSYHPSGFKQRSNNFKNRKSTISTTTISPEITKQQRYTNTSRSFKSNTIPSQSVAITDFTNKNNQITTEEESESNNKLNDILSKIKFQENLDQFLPKDYKEKTISTSTKKSITVLDDISKFLPPGYKLKTISTTTTTTKLPKIVSKNVSKLIIPFEDDISKFLPPNFKLNPNDKIDSSTSAIDITNIFTKNINFKNNQQLNNNEISTTLPSPQYIPSSTQKSDSLIPRVVFPKTLNKRPGIRPSITKSSGVEGPAPPKIVIKKGPPTRVTTEFTGWPSTSTTPISIEKLLEQQKAITIDISELLGQITSEATTKISSTTSTTTTTTTTSEPIKSTEPGLCHRDCDLAATIKIVGGVKWKPELLDHNTDEWKNLARDIETQLNQVYIKAPSLEKWYKKVRIDSFSKGSVLVDYFVELANISRDVNTQDIKKLFHEALIAAPLPVLPFSTNETIEKESLDATGEQINYRGGKLVKQNYILGRFVIDPQSTDFIVIPKQISPTIEFAEDDVLLPQWAIVVVVIGVGSLFFVVIFGVTVLVNRQKRSKKSPTPLTADMLNELNKNHMGGVDNYGTDEVYNLDDTWGDLKHPIKPKKFSNSMHGSHNSNNIYDSWRSQRHGDYFYDPHNYTPHQYDDPPYPSDGGHQMYTYNSRHSRYQKDYDPDF